MVVIEKDLTSKELRHVENILRAGTFKAPKGGYSNAQRGLITLESGRTVFGKQANDKQTAQWLSKEVAVYRWLNREDFAAAPRLLAASETCLVLPDLSAWDWSPSWTAQKLNSLFYAMNQLAKLSPHKDLSPLLIPHTPTEIASGWSSLVDDTCWDQVLRLAAKWQPSAVTHLSSLNQFRRKEIAVSVNAADFMLNQLVHMDIRADNVAYNADTNQINIIDWNWTELSSIALDKTLVAVSIMDQERFDISDTEVMAFADPHAALAAAGFWFLNCLNPPIKEGDPDGLRPLQFRSGFRALRMSSWLAPAN